MLNLLSMYLESGQNSWLAYDAGLLKHGMFIQHEVLSWASWTVADK